MSCIIPGTFIFLSSLVIAPLGKAVPSSVKNIRLGTLDVSPNLCLFDFSELCNIPWIWLDKGISIAESIFVKSPLIKRPGATLPSIGLNKAVAGIFWISFGLNPKCSAAKVALTTGISFGFFLACSSKANWNSPAFWWLNAYLNALCPGLGSSITVSVNLGIPSALKWANSFTVDLAIWLCTFSSIPFASE